ncbi:hypothetical protein THASP1DRAFT_21782 [Thamnocephalis sphaerospora]|uniref:Transmembrane protein n=1 Tax=Thamnocephalis sphaerospora TaxID=78915 RepID=A0A4V1IXB8_9FUNG|nr:hypothetical protein THASP1DRAFT_21782 [Thamnocephalis sphaerospora]|eukprot:RKP10509.1 hypothetical protein THASP1DRAFT_21782 [Thamnocephalis sphaerospora]
MAGVALYNRLMERMKEHPLRPEEVAALESARGKMSRNVMLGTTAGTVAGFLFSRRRGFNILPAILMTSFSTIVGMQFGVVTGTWAAMREIRNLPDSAHLLEIFRTIQDEMIQERMRGGRIGPQEAAGGPRAILRNASIDRDDQDMVGITTEPDANRPTEETQASDTPATSKSRWDEIRASNKKPSNWERIRQQASRPTAEGQSEPEPQGWRDASPDAPSEGFARTREDFERMRAGAKTHRNQYGDVVED